MQSLVVGDANEYYPKVCISYATGRRDGRDAQGCGPGMFYAARLAHALHKRGINVFSGLHVGAGADWHVFMDKLSGRFSECKLLVVIVTPDLYKSRPCLAEISCAIESGLKILPLLFENPIPKEKHMWMMIEKSDDEGKLMLSRALNTFCKLNTLPSPPGSMDATLIQRAVNEVARIVGQPAHQAQSEPEPEPEPEPDLHARAEAAKAAAAAEVERARALAEAEKARAEQARALAEAKKAKAQASVSPAPPVAAPAAQEMSRSDPKGYKANELHGKWKVSGRWCCSFICGKETWTAAGDDMLRVGGCVCVNCYCPCCYK